MCAKVKLRSGFGLTGHTEHKNTSKSTEIAITVCPDPGLGFHVYINLVSFAKKQHYPIGAIISEVGCCRVLCGADNRFTVLVQE